MDRSKNLETCLVIVIGLLIFYYFKEWKVLLLISVLVGLTGIFSKKLSGYINWFWYKLAELMGKVVSKIILTLFYFIILVPIAALFKITNRDILNSRKATRKSMWVNRDHTYTANDLSKSW